MGWAARANPTAQTVRRDPRAGRWMRAARAIPDRQTYDRLLAAAPDAHRPILTRALAPYLTFTPELEVRVLDAE